MARPRPRPSAPDPVPWPALTWAGRRQPAPAPAMRAVQTEACGPEGHPPEPGGAIRPNWPAAWPEGGLLFQGENGAVLSHLLASGFAGRVKLAYLDPPFDSGRDYVRTVTLRGTRGTPLQAGHGLAVGEQVQYRDAWDPAAYLQFMLERLVLVRDLLAADGTLYLHCDVHRTHHLRCLLEEVFGPENYRGEVVWQRFNFRADGRKFGTVHDTLHFVTRGPRYRFRKPRVAYKQSYLRSHFRPDATGRLFRLDNLTAPAHGPGGRALRFGDRWIAPPPGTMWRYAQERLDALWEAGRIEVSEAGVPQVRRFLDECGGQALHSVWTDLPALNSQARERTGYETQKPEALLARLIETSTDPLDIVLDCFVGSGTAAVAAQRLGRRWIACDANPSAIRTAGARLLRLIQSRSAVPGPAGVGDGTLHARRAFTTWRLEPVVDAPSGGPAAELPPGHVCRPSARVQFERAGDEIVVRVLEFTSPAIRECLAASGRGSSFTLDDWRAMVDEVRIDTAWDGAVFRVACADCPPSRADLVRGTYRLPAPSAPSTVAVRIVDLLGGEVLITGSV